MKVNFIDIHSHYSENEINTINLDNAPRIGDGVNLPDERYDDYFNGIVINVLWVIQKDNSNEVNICMERVK